MTQPENSSKVSADIVFSILGQPGVGTTWLSSVEEAKDKLFKSCILPIEPQIVKIIKRIIIDQVVEIGEVDEHGNYTPKSTDPGTPGT